MLHTFARLLLALALVGPLILASVEAQPPVRTVPSHASFNGQTYSEWSAEWWQWAYAQPTTNHALFDTADCSHNQAGRVWFLGGTFNTIGTDEEVLGEADRECSIPSGTALLFPIVNTVCDNVLVAGTEAELRDCANFLADHIQDVEVSVDRSEIEHLGLFRFETSLFEVGPLPADNIAGAPEGSFGQAVGDGFYVMLPPLSRGMHQINFSGELRFTAAEDGFDFVATQDIEYIVNVGR